MKSTRVYGIKYDMKSTRAFKILSIALAAAVVFYFLVQGVRYLTNPYATTRVYSSTTEESVEASGWLVREEPYPGRGRKGGKGPGHRSRL